MATSVKLFFVFAALLLPTFAAADTIHLQPGQCVLVGTQQVCALKDPAAAAASTVPQPKVVSTCKYGSYDKTEPAESKHYAHLLMKINGDGTTTETFIKSYGPLGKAECEREARSYRE